MKVILIENVDKLGSMGDVITVKRGYARNYLIPKKLAKEATPGNMKTLESILKKKASVEAKVLEGAKSIAERIAALSLSIPAQAGEEEKLFGSVSSEMISEALSHEGIAIDKRDIVIDEPIKKLGVYQVAVKIHPQVKASLKVWVVNK
ncbi:MAG: 50S ribosomal protein L9 [Candidatus Omnitrophica bacterium]|nr:50S ribosomal protein L9 [Candidatus Omnitrophota bacterium]